VKQLDLILLYKLLEWGLHFTSSLPKMLEYCGARVRSGNFCTGKNVIIEEKKCSIVSEKFPTFSIS